MAEEKKRKVVGVEDPKIETKRLTIFLIAVFGIAWIENVTTENNVQTRYGADPTLL